MSGNSKKAYNTLKALTKTQQHKSAVIEDSSGNILTKSTAILNWWTEYCSGLYNCELHQNTSLLQSNQTSTQEDESLPVLREEVEEAVCTLKAESLWEWTTFPLSGLRMVAFNRVWHAGLWQVLRSFKFNIDEGLTQTIHALKQCSPLEQSARGSSSRQQ